MSGTSANFIPRVFHAELISVFVSVYLQTLTEQHDGHSDEQQLGSLAVQRQAEDYARQVSMTVRALSSCQPSLRVD